MIICFSYRDLLYHSLSSSPDPQCICTHLLSCCQAAHPRVRRPASFNRMTHSSRYHCTSSLCRNCVSLIMCFPFFVFQHTLTHTYDFSPSASCCNTEKPNRASSGPLKMRGFFTSMLKHWHNSERHHRGDYHKDDKQTERQNILYRFVLNRH